VTKKKQKQKPGPRPEILKIEGHWKDATKKSLQKKRPPSGWPKTDYRLWDFQAAYSCARVFAAGPEKIARRTTPVIVEGFHAPIAGKFSIL
jgi:hypothetical protein